LGFGEENESGLCRRFGLAHKKSTPWLGERRAVVGFYSKIKTHHARRSIERQRQRVHSNSYIGLSENWLKANEPMGFGLYTKTARLRKG
jgi:hypothetical protein